MLEANELADTAALFGVPDEQVLHDHLISHILAALATLDQPVVFFGGTALARTHLAGPDVGGRLSEDIDLLTARRSEVAAVLDTQLPRLLRREFPGASWNPPLPTVKAVEPGRLVTRGGLGVRIQLLSGVEHREFAQFPTEVRPVELRYRDLPDQVLLTVPTLVGAAAMKVNAWRDRRTSRDLYDLAMLARTGALTAEVATLVRRITGVGVAEYDFRATPADDWVSQLEHQTRHLPAARECLDAVRAAFAVALGWPSPTRTLD